MLQYRYSAKISVFSGKAFQILLVQSDQACSEHLSFSFLLYPGRKTSVTEFFLSTLTAGVELDSEIICRGQHELRVQATPTTIDDNQHQRQQHQRIQRRPTSKATSW